MVNALAIENEDILVDMDEPTHQYVTFQVADELFAFPMASVLEIIRFPETVQVPLTSGALVGLANLRGSVLPVIDLRRLLKLPDRDYSDATRVIVADAGTPVGLAVDRVSRVMSVEESAIGTSKQMQSNIDAAYLSGVIHGGEREPLIQLLDFRSLVSQEFSAVLAKATDHQQALQIDRLSSNSKEAEDSEQIVSFLVDDQEYAFDLMEVEEIVRVPDMISRIPCVEEHVLGLIDLRGRLLPLVSMRRLFCLDDKAVDENHRILVISLRRPGGHRDSVGLVVDDVREVFRVNWEERDAVPTLLGDKDSKGDITAICRLNGGTRLVSVLSTASLFQYPAIQAAVETRGNKEDPIKMTDKQFEPATEEDDTAQLVVFNLGDQEFGVSIDDVQEITRVPEQLDQVPKTPDFIEGMVNLRGMVLPVLDMRTRFGLEKCKRNDRQRIIVLSLDGRRTGFIVDSVAEVLRLPQERIESAPNLSDEQARIMDRVVNLKEEKRMIQVVTAQELLSDQEVREIDEGK